MEDIAEKNCSAASIFTSFSLGTATCKRTNSRLFFSRFLYFQKSKRKYPSDTTPAINIASVTSINKTFSRVKMIYSGVGVVNIGYKQLLICLHSDNFPVNYLECDMGFFKLFYAPLRKPGKRAC